MNVWSPGLGSAAKKPVMVWFHGGAFSYGTANAPRQQGSRLAKRGEEYSYAFEKAAVAWHAAQDEFESKFGRSRAKTLRAELFNLTSS